MRRVLIWVLKLIFAHLVWNRAFSRLRHRVARAFSIRSLFGESVALWLQMRRSK